MDAQVLKRFKVREAPSAKFYVTRQGQAFCTRAGQLVYFETERDARKFLAEIGDIVLKADNGPRRSRSQRGRTKNKRLRGAQIEIARTPRSKSVLPPRNTPAPLLCAGAVRHKTSSPP
jgi:hypothetical protein